MWHWTGTLRGQSSSGHSRQLAHDEVLAQVSGRKHPAAKLGLLFIWFLDFVLFWAESHSQPWLTWSSMQTTLELPASAAIKGMHRHAWPFVYLGMVLQLRTAFTVLNRGEENKIILKREKPVSKNAASLLFSFLQSEWHPWSLHGHRPPSPNTHCLALSKKSFSTSAITDTTLY